MVYQLTNNMIQNANVSCHSIEENNFVFFLILHCWSTTVIAAGQLCLASAVSYGAYHFSQGKFWTKIRLKFMRTEPIPLVKLENIPYVTNKIALERIRDGFEDKFGGIQVLYAPTGSGKTTYLAKAAVQNKKDKKHVEFISCAANKKHIYDCLGIPNLSFN